nr:hypothetical protein CDS [Bradyrhizobium sp.]
MARRTIPDRAETDNVVDAITGLNERFDKRLTRIKKPKRALRLHCAARSRRPIGRWPTTDEIRDKWLSRLGRKVVL